MINTSTPVLDVLDECVIRSALLKGWGELSDNGLADRARFVQLERELQESDQDLYVERVREVV